MGRSPCCEKVGLKKGPWTPEEDQKLMAFIQQHGHGSWRALPAKAGLRRCGKSCRLRWTNYLRPDIKRGKFSLQEERTIIQLHALLGNRWSAIASHLPKRTDNEIKNYWNTNLKKRLTRMGIDPVTHKPKTNSLGQCNNNKDTFNLSHMAQWESARLEAEARLVRESKLQAQLSSYSSPARLILNKINAQPSLPPCLDVLKAWQSSWSNYSNSKSLPQTNIDNNRMHSMLAMMLASDDLDSPTSTLSFPESMHPIISRTTTTTTPIGLINENLLPPTTLPVSTAMDIDSLDHQRTKSSAPLCEGGEVIKDAGVIESWRCLTNQNPEAEGETETTMDNAMEGLHLQDDDIMVAFEAFRGVGNENNDVMPLISSNYVMEGINNDMVVFDSYQNLAEENLAFVNGDGTSFNLNCFEENRDYWSYCMLNFVNDSQPGSPML